MYVGDTRLEVLTTYALTRDTRLPRKALRMFDISRQLDGLTQSRYPTRVFQSIPPFSLWWVMMVHDYARWRDDMGLCSQPYARRARCYRTLPAPYRFGRSPPCRRRLELFRLGSHVEGRHTTGRTQTGTSECRGCPASGRRGDKGNVEGRKGKGRSRIQSKIANPKSPIPNSLLPTQLLPDVSGPVTWQMVWALRLLAELETFVGERNWQRGRNDWAAQLALRANEVFWNEERGLFGRRVTHAHYSEHSQCLALSEWHGGTGTADAKWQTAC